MFTITTFLIGLAALTTTLLGGMFALKLRDRLHLLLGFSAGAIIGVAFFDLLPEAIELAEKSYSVSTVCAVIAAGFVVYMLLDRLITLHSDQEEEGHHHHRGVMGASSLVFHSFLDGVAIGLSFQVSVAIGSIVATAVLIHKFSDGINTVNMILRSGGSQKSAIKWLAISAAVPVLGVWLSVFFALPQESLGLLLAVFCGFFIYIGASDLLPETHHSHQITWTTAMTVLGMATIYLAIKFAGT